MSGPTASTAGPTSSAARAARRASGWQIIQGGNPFMAGTRKAEAMKQLRLVVADYFDR